MKQFNLQEYLKNPSRKVITRGGKNARIICTDAISENPIIALVLKSTDKNNKQYRIKSREIFSTFLFFK